MASTTIVVANTDSSTDTGGVINYNYALANGSGNNRCLVVICTGHDTTAPSSVTCTFNGVAADYTKIYTSQPGTNHIWQTISIFLDATLPSSAGTYQIEHDVDSSPQSTQMYIREYSNASQQDVIYDTNGISEAGAVAPVDNFGTDHPYFDGETIGILVSDGTDTWSGENGTSVYENTFESITTSIQVINAPLELSWTSTNDDWILRNVFIGAYRDDEKYPTIYNTTNGTDDGGDYSTTIDIEVAGKNRAVIVISSGHDATAASSVTATLDGVAPTHSALWTYDAGGSINDLWITWNVWLESDLPAAAGTYTVTHEVDSFASSTVYQIHSLTNVDQNDFLLQNAGTSDIPDDDNQASTPDTPASSALINPQTNQSGYTFTTVVSNSGADPFDEPIGANVHVTAFESKTSAMQYAEGASNDINWNNSEPNWLAIKYFVPYGKTTAGAFWLGGFTGVGA